MYMYRYRYIFNIYVYMCMCVYVCVCIYIYICRYAYICIDTQFFLVFCFSTGSRGRDYARALELGALLLERGPMA